MGKLFDYKTCVYLDQFAVSNLSENKDWMEVLDLLEKGVTSQKIVIPYSVEHLLESSQKDFEKAQIADTLLFKLSLGVGLEPEYATWAKLLIAAIRNKPITRHIYYHKVQQPAFENMHHFDKFKSLKATFNQWSLEASGNLNTLRAMIRNNNVPDLNHLKISVSATSHRYQTELENRLKKYSRYGFFDRREIHFTTHTIPFWADSLMDILTSTYFLTKQEAKKGESILKSNGIKKVIPTLYIRTALETILSLKQQHETANDYIDIQRLATAIPCSDIVLTDKSKVYDIKMLELDKEYKVQAYSGTQNDINNFIQHLKSIL